MLFGLRVQSHYAGPGRIAGTTLAGGTPVSRRVRLHECRSGAVVAETWSDAVGAWRLDSLVLDIDFYVIARDHTGLRDAVIHDRIRAGVPS